MRKFLRQATFSPPPHHQHQFSTLSRREKNGTQNFFHKIEKMFNILSMLKSDPFIFLKALSPRGKHYLYGAKGWWWLENPREAVMAKLELKYVRHGSVTHRCQITTSFFSACRPCPGPNCKQKVASDNVNKQLSFREICKPTPKCKIDMGHKHYSFKIRRIF